MDIAPPRMTRLPEQHTFRRAQTPDHSASAAADAADIHLVTRCAAHDPAALRELSQRYQARIMRLLFQILASREDAEEAAQDVFLSVWQQAHTFQARASVANWLYRIAANAAYDLLRRRKAQRRQPVLEPGAPDTDNAETQALDGIEREGRAVRLQAALQTLRPEERLLLALYYMEELGYAQISDIMRQTYPVLKMRLLRARKRLRTAYETLPGESDNP